jgi:LPS sulfotransferase NodH
MNQEIRFVVFSLPRSGSTTLARLLSSHHDIRCLLEPFHPQRYDGRFHSLATRGCLRAALEHIWHGWNGIKHVWGSSGWPFPGAPEINGRIALGFNQTSIVVMRRNLLRRIVSNVISRQTGYWIGTRSEFCKRLDQIQLKALDPNAITRQMKHDQQAVANHLRFLEAHSVIVRRVFYEDLFGDDVQELEQLQVINSLLAFLRLSQFSPELFRERWLRYSDPAVNRWATEEVYLRIPGIDRIERQVGCDETGWLFR